MVIYIVQVQSVIELFGKQVNNGILTCALFLKSRDFRDIKNYIRERFPKKEGEKTNNHR